MTRTRETYEKDVEEMRTRRDAELSELQEQLLHKEEQKKEQDKSIKEATEQHRVRGVYPFTNILLVCVISCSSLPITIVTRYIINVQIMH